jgi:hypothetical protein
MDMPSRRATPAGKMGALLVVSSVVAVMAQMKPPALPEPPRQQVETTIAPSQGRTIHVPAGGDLQAAVNGAQPGDVLSLDPAATYQGTLLLPVKPGAGWITVRTSSSDADLGSARVSPASASRMARLVSSSGSVISLAPGAHHYRFIGVEISPAPGTFLYNLVGPAQDARSEAEEPHHLIFDRCYLHGDPMRGSRRAIALNGRDLAIIHSYVSDFKEPTNDSQALAGWNGSGPIKIVDNYLEGATENVMFGGSDAGIPNLVPSDIEIRGNTFAKNRRWDARDPAYDASHWPMKNLLELKNARRVLIEGNVFENFHGFAFVVTPRNQSGGSPWSTVEDVTVRYNWIRRVSSLISISGFDEYHPSQPTRRVMVEHNVVESMYDTGESNPKAILINQGPDDVTIRHNTILTTPGLGSSFLYFANAMKKGTAFAFADNIAHVGTYGLGAENPGAGSTTASLLSGHFNNWTLTGNVLINSEGAATNPYPAGQHWEPSLKAVGFRDPANHDYRLIPKSRYQGAAIDRTDPGANIDALFEVMSRFMSVPGPLAASR